MNEIKWAKKEDISKEEDVEQMLKRKKEERGKKRKKQIQIKGKQMRKAVCDQNRWEMINQKRRRKEK